MTVRVCEVWWFGRGGSEAKWRGGWGSMADPVSAWRDGDLERHPRAQTQHQSSLLVASSSTVFLVPVYFVG